MLSSVTYLKCLPQTPSELSGRHKLFVTSPQMVVFKLSDILVLFWNSIFFSILFLPFRKMLFKRKKRQAKSSSISTQVFPTLPYLLTTTICISNGISATEVNSCTTMHSMLDYASCCILLSMASTHFRCLCPPPYLYFIQ